MKRNVALAELFFFLTLVETFLFTCLTDVGGEIPLKDYTDNTLIFNSSLASQGFCSNVSSTLDLVFFYSCTDMHYRPLFIFQCIWAKS